MVAGATAREGMRMTEYFDTRDLVVVPHIARAGYGEQARGPHVVTIHPGTQCAGEVCVFHNPMPHRLSQAPMNIRFDNGALVERICEHGVGHPDPDSVAYFVRRDPKNGKYMGVHGCDGCCGPLEEG